jgi:hypothetical protein
VWLLISGTGPAGRWLAHHPEQPGDLLLALAAELRQGFCFRPVRIIPLDHRLCPGWDGSRRPQLFGMEPWSSTWILTFLAGGVLGLVLATFARGIGIMVITALGGAAMVMIGLPDLGVPVASSLMNLAGPLVAVAGFIVQYSTRGRD